MKGQKMSMKTNKNQSEFIQCIICKKKRDISEMAKYEFSESRYIGKEKKELNIAHFFCKTPCYSEASLAFSLIRWKFTHPDFIFPNFIEAKKQVESEILTLNKQLLEEKITEKDSVQIKQKLNQMHELKEKIEHLDYTDFESVWELYNIFVISKDKNEIFSSGCG